MGTSKSARSNSLFNPNHRSLPIPVSFSSRRLCYIQTQVITSGNNIIALYSMNLTPTQALEVLKRFPSLIAQSASSKHQFNQNRRSRSKTQASIHTQIQKLSSKPREIKPYFRHSISYKNFTTSKPVKVSKSNKKLPTHPHPDDLSRKLLSDIHKYQMQIRALKSDKEELSRKIKDFERYIRLSYNKQVNAIGCFCDQTPIKQYLVREGKYLDESQATETPRTNFDPNFDMRMVVSRHITCRENEEREGEREKEENQSVMNAMRDENQQLKRLVEDLEERLERYQNESLVSIEAKPAEKQMKSQGIQVLTLQFSQPQQSKGERELELQKQIQRLSGEIRHMRSNNTKLKDRARAIVPCMPRAR